MAMTLNPGQTAAVEKLAHTRNGALIGNAGTGKTTSALALIDLLRTTGYNPVLTAPTHKAAKILQEKARTAASTLHAALKLVPVPDNKTGGRALAQKGQSDLIPGKDVLLVDEASMLSPYLLDRIVDEGVDTIYIGDDAQLPPVGYNVPTFLERLPWTPHTLTQIMRQAGDNPLPQIAQTWRPGLPAYHWPTATRLGTDGGVEVIDRPAATARFVAAGKAHLLAGADDSAVEPWLSFTNAAAAAMGDAVRMAALGSGAMQPYTDGELMVTCSPLISEGKILLPVTSVVRIVSPPTLECLHAYDEDWVAYSMTVVADDRGPRHEVLAMPFQTRQALLQTASRAAMQKQERYPRLGGAAVWADYYAFDDGILDLRTIYSSTVHRSQGSTYPNCYLDKSDMENPYAAGIRRALVYTAMTRAAHTAVVAK